VQEVAKPPGNKPVGENRHISFYKKKKKKKKKLFPI